MSKWGGLKRILIVEESKSSEQITEETGSLRSTSIDLARLRCRTPMGSYKVPQGGKPLTSLGDSCPGPADYRPKVDLAKTAAPQYSIVGKPKIADGKRYNPGPSEYNTAGDANWKNKKITLKGRGKSWFDEQAEKSISLLGKYKVNHLAMGSEGPKFKVGKKESIYTGPVSSLVHPVDTKGFSTPGPNYRPNSSYWGRGPKKSFGIRTGDGQHQGPGPGDYDAVDSSRGPSHSFGMKLPEPVFVQQSVNKFSPAANTYDIGTTIGKAPAVSIAGRPKEPKEEQYLKKPGPADYNVTHVNLKTNPRYTCRQRVKTSYPDSVTYDRVENDNPGPGSYNLVKDFVANDNPSYSLRKRLEPVVDRDRLPGPNAYESEKKSKPGSKRAPAFSMAKRLVQPNCMKETPGPGEYQPNLPSTERGKYTMTMRPKGKGGFVNPAPNLYTLPEAIAGRNKGVALKSRASPYVYSGFRTNKFADPTALPVISN